MQFRIGETTYNGAALDQLSLVDVLMLEQSCEQMGRPVKWGQVQEWVNELDAIVRVMADETRTRAARQEAEREHRDHPGAIWVMALVIWASRRLAGEKLTFLEAVEFPMSDLTWIQEPANRAERRAGNPTKARPLPKGSGRAGKPQPSKRTAKASSRPSTPA